MTDNTQMLSAVNYKFSQSNGCCGMHELYRLKASYETMADAEERHKHMVTMGIPMTLVATAPYLHELVHNMLESTMCWPIPVEWGYTHILSKLYHGARSNIIVMSDNMDDEGDVHIGPFGTKHFAKWVQTMDIGDVHEVPARKSHRGSGHMLQVWVWHPDWNKVSTLVKQCLVLAREYFKEIEDAEKDIKQQRADANAKLIEKLATAAGWE